MALIMMVIMGTLIGAGVQRSHDLKKCKAHTREEVCKKDLHIPESK